MALIQCPECGSEISDAAGVCPHCGYPVLQGAEKLSEESKTTTPNAETGLTDGKQKGKKKIIAICAVIAITIIGIIAGIAVHKSNIKKQVAEEYQAYLNLAVDGMLSGASGAEKCCGMIHDVWYNTIYEKSDIATDEFTKATAFEFNSDFNTSLQNLFQDDDFSSLVDTIKRHQTIIEDVMKNLGNPTEEYRAAYNAVFKLYEAYLSLTDMAINPTGSLQTFTANFNDADSNFMKCYRAAQIYTD